MAIQVGPDLDPNGLKLNTLMIVLLKDFLKELPAVKKITDHSKAVLLLCNFYVLFCLVFAMPLCASVYMCLVVTCWERADLFALVCGV